MTKRVFISYSHDSDEHKANVVKLAKRLHDDGVEVRLDQRIEGTPDQGWPRWMLDQFDWAEYVLLVCTEKYYHRFRGHVAPDEGKGVVWEGAIVTQEIYDSQYKTKKFVPVMFAAANKIHIPEPVRQHTYYVLNSEETYQKLYDFILCQGDVDFGPKGELKIKPRKTTEPLTFSGNDKESSLSDSQTNGIDQEVNPYTVHNTDFEFKKFVCQRIQEILDKTKMKCIREQIESDLSNGKENSSKCPVAIRLLELPVLKAQIELEKSVKKCFQLSDLSRADREGLWGDLVDITGWLLLLTVNPEWRKKSKTIIETRRSIQFSLSIIQEECVDIAMSSIAEQSARLDGGSTKRVDGCNNISVELGINTTDSAMQIARAIYIALQKTEPDMRNTDFIKSINSDLLASAERNEYQYLTIDRADETHPLNNPGVFQELLRLLPTLNLIHIGVKGENTDTFLIAESDLTSNIRKFLKIGAELREKT